MSSRVLANRYELLEKIGEGGMAVVFKAKDMLLDRFVALKILRPEYTQDESFIDSFNRESQLVAGIVDTNIVQVYDVGLQGNIHYIVMELVEGETLSEIIKREGSLDPETVVSYGKQIAMALSTAHKNNLIHRDIKPHNIMVTFDGIAKLTDFGIAKRVTNDTLVGDEKEAVMGSIHYFSPEQARGNSVDERSDIYSLGIVMYEMATGKVPYDGDNAVEVAVKHMNEKMIPPSHIKPEIPQDLEDIILKATSKSAADRYKNAEEMIIALNFVKFSKMSDYAIALQNGEPVDSQPIVFDDDDCSDEPEETMSAQNNKKPKFVVKQRTMAIILAIALAIPTGILIAKIIRNANKGPSEVTVPDLYEMSYDSAEALLESMGLKINIDTEVYSTKYEKNTIVSQDTDPDTKVKPGYTIRVNVTRSGEAVSVVPSKIVGYDLESARVRLENYGYSIENTTYEFDNSDEGTVISCNPKEGSALEKGGKVKLIVSKGPDPEKKFKLDLVGMTLDEARALIEEKGCTISDIQYSANTKVDEGCVLTQYPSSSVYVEPGTAFKLSVRMTAVDDPDDEEKDVDLTVLYDSITDEEFTVSIILTDSNNETVTQYSKIAVKKSDNSGTFTIHGKGKVTVTVVAGNQTFQNINVDFDVDKEVTVF